MRTSSGKRSAERTLWQCLSCRVVCGPSRGRFRGREYRAYGAEQCVPDFGDIAGSVNVHHLCIGGLMWKRDGIVLPRRTRAGGHGRASLPGWACWGTAHDTGACGSVGEVERWGAVECASEDLVRPQPAPRRGQTKRMRVWWPCVFAVVCSEWHPPYSCLLLLRFLGGQDFYFGSWEDRFFDFGSWVGRSARVLS